MKYGTEKIADVIKQFLLEKVNALLPEYEDDKIKLPLFNDKAIVHGAVDASRLDVAVTVAILIENQSEVDTDAISEHTFDTEINLVILCAKASYDVLVARACRYAGAVKKAMFAEPSFKSEAYPDRESGAFTASGFGKLEIDYDAGAVGGQMVGISLNLTVRTDEL